MIGLPSMPTLVLAGAVTAAIGGLWWWGGHQQERAAGNAVLAEQYQAALVQQVGRVDALQAQVDASDRARQAASDRLSAWQSAFERWRRNDNDLEAWSDLPLPAGAADLMCQYARCNGGGMSPDRPDPGAAAPVRQ